MSGGRMARGALLLLPLLEILVIVGVGKAIGVWWTIGLLVLGSITGAALIARGGRRALDALRRTLQLGDPPDRRMANAVLTVAGGVLLLVPGFITDVAGLLFVLPPTRRFARVMLGAVAARTAGRLVLDMQLGAPGGPGAPGGSAGPAGPPGAARGPDFGSSSGGPRIVPSEVIRSHDTTD